MGMRREFAMCNVLESCEVALGSPIRKALASMGAPERPALANRPRRTSCPKERFTMTRRHLLGLLSAIGLASRSARADDAPSAIRIEPLQLSDTQWKERLSP